MYLNTEPSLHTEMLSIIARMHVWDKKTPSFLAIHTDIVIPEYILFGANCLKLPLTKQNSKTVFFYTFSHIVYI